MRSDPAARLVLPTDWDQFISNEATRANVITREHMGRLLHRAVNKWEERGVEWSGMGWGVDCGGWWWDEDGAETVISSPCGRPEWGPA